MGQLTFRLLGDYSLVIILGLLLVTFSLLRPEQFFTVDNYRGIAVNQIVVVFAAIGLIAPLIVGELDLSFGYIIGLSQALVIGLMSLQGLDPLEAVISTVAICIFVGCINGLLVVKARINSLIATLATGSVLYGIILWYTKGTVLFERVPPSFLKIASLNLIDVPLPIWYGIGLIVITEVVLGYLPVGRRMYAVGGNRRAAVLTGIRVERLIIGAFATSAFVSGLGGIIVASRLGSAEPELGAQFLLPAYAAAFLGATVIRPGRFNAIGTAVAVYVLAVIVAGLQQTGVPSWAEYMIDGAALATGVALANRLVRIREERARRDQLRALEEGRVAVASIE
jgi:ribose transport system permease protein